MGRKPIKRDLPALDELMPAFEGYPESENSTNRLYRDLKRIVVKVRRTESIPFYSIRQVAQFFNVPYATAARVYRLLHDEGDLVRIRGSVTLVQGTEKKPTKAVTGVVGVPIWLFGFVRMNDWRLFYLALERELRKRSLVADFVFFRSSEASHPDFADRLMHYSHDYLVWLLPLPLSIPVMQRLEDSGVRVITLSTEQHQFPFYNYRLSWRSAITQGLAEWRSQGIKKVVVIGEDNREEYISLGRMLADEAMDAHYMLPSVSDRSSLDRLYDLPPDTGVLIYDGHEAALLHERIDVHRLVQSQRVMTRFYFGFSGSGSDKLGSACMDWSSIAYKLSSAIATGEIYESSEKPLVFKAAWMPDTPLGKLASHL